MATYGDIDHDNEESESVYPTADYMHDPNQCDECKAWCDNSNDHAPDCPYFEEQPLPF